MIQSIKYVGKTQKSSLFLVTSSEGEIFLIEIIEQKISFSVHTKTLLKNFQANKFSVDYFQVDSNFYGIFFDGSKLVVSEIYPDIKKIYFKNT